MEIPNKIELKVGESYTLRLKGMGSAGYTWEYAVNGDTRAINVLHETVGERPEAPPGGPPPDNYSLDHLFTIQALVPGRL